jgi:hypothetical protein
MPDGITKLGNQPVATEEIPAISEPAPKRDMPEIVITPMPAPAIVPEPVVPEVPMQSQSSSPTPTSEPLPGPALIEVPPPKSASYFLTLALESIQFRKKRKLDKIMKFVAERGSITNDQAEKLLHVSDATATRYLHQLVQKGSLKRNGMTSDSKYTL